MLTICVLAVGTLGGVLTNDWPPHRAIPATLLPAAATGVLLGLAGVPW